MNSILLRMQDNARDFLNRRLPKHEIVNRRLRELETLHIENSPAGNFLKRGLREQERSNVGRRLLEVKRTGKRETSSTRDSF